MENIGKNIAAELDEIAKRVIDERKINSIVRIDGDAMSNCIKFINRKIFEIDDFAWMKSLMVTAVIKFRPIQRLSDNIRTDNINEIFAITIITDFMPHVFKTEKYYPRERSGSFLRNLFGYFLNGSNDPHAILLTLQCITSPESE
ncbi:MAG: hypothetical protein IJ575_10665 [Selenomonadaceae bacterium]|nr:hypothetical protein [Selenomonadaceae bacterium]